MGDANGWLAPGRPEQSGSSGQRGQALRATCTERAEGRGGPEGNTSSQRPQESRTLGKGWGARCPHKAQRAWPEQDQELWLLGLEK